VTEAQPAMQRAAIKAMPQRVELFLMHLIRIRTAF
jgi:hypothetical protein